jgi:hypothetical protein
MSKPTRRRLVEEMGFVSSRIDPAVYAQQALEGLASAIAPVNERRQGYIRDELREAFTAGEHQGVVRGIQILTIARARATDSTTVAALEACLRLLGVETSR